MSDLVSFLRTFAQFPFSLHRFLQHPLTQDAAEKSVHEGMEHRAERLLDMLTQSVYANPASPYLALLSHADITLQDIRTLTQTKGITETLRRLRAEGVYVTYEEFKGRKPIVRGSLTQTPSPRAFDNLAAHRDFSLTTGGSTGVANTVYQDLDHVAALATNELLLLQAHGYLDASTVHWTHMLPGSGLRFILQRALHQQSSQKWFSPIGWRDLSAWFKYDSATLYMLTCMRLRGISMGVPEIAKPENAHAVTEYVRRVLDRQGKCLVYCNVSQAVRLSLAALNAGTSLRGAAVRLMSEPLTDAKAARITESGLTIIAGYGSIETGAISVGCACPSATDDSHVLLDAFAIFDYPVPVPGANVSVPSLNLTSLRPSSPKVMLNYQSDDYGTLTTRNCGCPLSTYGYTMHLNSIRSYSKFVGEGVTLIGNELFKMIEEQLPARFGGTPLDYQWMEQEDMQGFTRLVLLIDPRVTIADETQVIPFVLDNLRRTSGYTDAARVVWQSAQTLRVERRTPILTARTKLLPLHLTAKSQTLRKGE